MTSSKTGARTRTNRTIGITAGLIGWLFLVEITSGILQGYYVPLISDIVKHLGIHDADYNWFEAAQLLLSALVVPVLAKLGDMFGHKRILLVATVLTALASWGIAFAGNFTGYLVAFALQGFYTVWLPLEIALIFDRGRRTGTAASTHTPCGRAPRGRTRGRRDHRAPSRPEGCSRRSARTCSSPSSSRRSPSRSSSSRSWFGVPESEPMPGKRRLDVAGFTMLTLSLLLITSGLTFLRINGPGAVWVWALIVVGVAVIVPFVRYELRQDDPAIDIRVFRQPNMWPVQLTAGLIGISLLGAQAPLSTFAGTDPKNGYGLGLDATDRSTLIGVYLVSMIIGAVLFPLVSRWTKPRVALIGASFLVAVGYLLFLPFHQETWQVMTNMAIAGIGSGALVGALPAAAAAAAPRGQTGIAAALTNTTKTIGGSFASAVFGVVLLTGATAVTATAASLFGYMLVWTICGLGALVAAVLLFFVPKLAFADTAPEEGVTELATPVA